MLSRFFNLNEAGTTVKTEILAGITTFLTMAYIIVVQPLVLTGRMFGFETGMDFGAVMAATCISAAAATTIMAFYAKYPIAQAPGMGQNFFFTLTAIPAAAAAGFANTWQTALGVVFISGVLFLALSLAGVRRMIIDAVSSSMKNAMAVGIGLFIAFIGLQGAGLIVTAASIVQTDAAPVLSPGTLVRMTPHFASIDIMIFLAGLVLTSVLHVRRVRGSILIGIIGTTVIAAVIRGLLSLLPESVSLASFFHESQLLTRFEPASGILSAPPSLSPTFLKMDIKAALSFSMIPIVLVFLFMDIFDTMGTLIGVSEQAGFIKDGKLPRLNKALVSDAVGTVAGACLGTSTVTSYIESAAGVEEGGRTGLTGVTTAVLFLLSLFFMPVIMMIGSYPVITAPALIVVGAMMIRNVVKIDWQDYSESIPSFLMILAIPLSYSIGDGLAIGFIAYPVIKILSGKSKDIGWMMGLLGLVLFAYFLFVRGGV